MTTIETTAAEPLRPLRCYDFADVHDLAHVASGDGDYVNFVDDRFTEVVIRCPSSQAFAWRP